MTNGRLLVTESARRRVEAALEVARRTTTLPGERAAAIAAAERVVTANGLDRASFAWPGEERRAPPASRFTDDLFERPRSPAFKRGFYTREELDDVMARFREHTAASAAAFEAFRHYAEAEAAMRAEAIRTARRQMDRLAADIAVNWLWRNDVRVYPTTAAEDGSRRWVAPETSDLEYSDAGIIELAKAAGYEP
jgi:hypothetical protein